MNFQIISNQYNALYDNHVNDFKMGLKLRLIVIMGNFF